MWKLIVLLIGTATVHTSWIDKLENELEELDYTTEELNDALEIPTGEKNDAQPCETHSDGTQTGSGCNTAQRLESCDRHWKKVGCYKEMESSVMLLDDRHKDQNFLNVFYSKGYYTDVTHFESSTHSLACRCAKIAKMRGYRYFSLRYWGMCHAIATTTMLAALDDPKASESENCASSSQLRLGTAKCDPELETECLGMEADFVYSLYQMDPTEDQNIDGGLSKWSAWSRCNVKCGTGKQTRQRSCTNPPPKGIGAPCSDPLEEEQECTLCDCPVDGGFSEWTSFSVCSKTCGGGMKTKRRTCTNPRPDKGGLDCVGPTEETETCEQFPCPIDGCYSQWSAFGPCSAICGEGEKTRTRQCNSPAPAFNGTSCAHLGDALEKVKCNDKPCPINGGYTGWSNYSRCSAKCGGGKKARLRMCTDPSPQHGGLPCNGTATETIDCNTEECPQHGGWSPWIQVSSPIANIAFSSGGMPAEPQVWTACSVSCGGGTRSKSRRCTNPTPNYGGDECVGDATVVEECNTHKCEVHGGWSHWSPFGECSHWCRDENGASPTMKRDRSCTDPSPKYGGNQCSTKQKGDTDVKPCNTNFFCPVDGGYTNWGEWTPCSEPCKAWDRQPGKQIRSRSCTNPAPRHDGFPCEWTQGEPTEERVCNQQACSMLTNWGSWSKCTKTCGGGRKTRTRTCTGGEDTCQGPFEESTDCESQPCPIDGVYGQWTPWTACSKPCDSGHRNRSRKCDSPKAAFGGKPCPGLNFASEECQIKPCPRHGNWGGWSTFGLCSKSCKGGGLKTRTRDCGDPSPLYGGRACAPEPSNGVMGVEKVSCNEDVNCPVDCVWAQWTPWRRCSKSCGKGRTGRYRRTATPALHGGRCIGKRFDVKLCNTEHCPINGQWGGWSNWGACSKSCGGGIQHSSRRCDKPEPQYDGCKQCPGEKSRSRECNTGVQCPVDGAYGKWTEWSKCSHECGLGTKTRTRVCTPPLHGGMTCMAFGESKDTMPCNNHVCPKDGTACACQGESAKLSCKLGNGNIHIKEEHDVYYGRREKEVCADMRNETKHLYKDWNFDCQATGGKEKVSALCEGKQECEIPVNNGFFGNPCQGTYKYLRVHYECRGGQYAELRHFCNNCLHTQHDVTVEVKPSVV